MRHNTGLGSLEGAFPRFSLCLLKEQLQCNLFGLLKVLISILTNSESWSRSRSRSGSSRDGGSGNGRWRTAAAGRGFSSELILAGGVDGKEGSGKGYDEHEGRPSCLMILLVSKVTKMLLPSGLADPLRIELLEL